MKIALITTGAASHIKEIAKKLQDELIREGIDTELTSAEFRDGRYQVSSVSIYRSDLVVIGSPAIPWRGDIPAETREYIEGTSLLEGKMVAVFVDRTIWGSRSALRHLMSAAEKRGAYLVDFEILSNSQSIGFFARRLLSVKKS